MNLFRDLSWRFFSETRADLQVLTSLLSEQTVLINKHNKLICINSS